MSFPLPMCVLDCLLAILQAPSCDGVQKHLAGSLADLDLLGVQDAMQYHVGEFPTLTDFAASLTDNLDTSGCCGPKPKIVNEMTAQMKRAKSDVEKRLLRFIEQNGRRIQILLLSGPRWMHDRRVGTTKSACTACI